MSDTPNAETVPPLEDPSYVPKYQPVGGRPPDIVAKWGALSQVRWFARFPRLALPSQVWARFYVQSTEHRGLCCESCLQDAEYQGYPNSDDHCCCHIVSSGDA